MIKEFSVRPNPSNNNAKLIFWATLMAGALFMVASMMIDRYRGVVSLVALGLFCTAIFFYTKFISSYYMYDVTFDSDNTAVFVVRQITGKRQSTHCRIALFEITDIVKETKEERKKHQTPLGTRKYVYFPTFSPDLCYRIISKNRYESSEILVEFTDQMAELLSDYVKEAKELEALRQEDY